MKKNISFLIIMVILIITTAFVQGCKKTIVQEDTNIPASIIGSWELRQSQAGTTPTINYSTGSGNLLIFTSTNYFIYTNSQLAQSGKYIIIKDSTASSNTSLAIPSGQFTNRIIYDGDYNATKTFIQISNNKLITILGNFSLDAGIISTYEKQ